MTHEKCLRCSAIDWYMSEDFFFGSGVLTSVQEATQAPSGAKGKTTWALAMAAAAAATMAEAKRMVNSGCVWG